MWILEAQIEFVGRIESYHDTYTLRAVVSSTQLDNSKLIPVQDLKNILKDCIPPNKNLLKQFSFKPTLENMAEYFYKKLRSIINSRSIVLSVESVTIVKKVMSDTPVTYKL